MPNPTNDTGRVPPGAALDQLIAKLEKLDKASTHHVGGSGGRYHCRYCLCEGFPENNDGRAWHYGSCLVFVLREAAEALRAALDAPPETEMMEVQGTYACQICGLDSPHSHDELPQAIQAGCDLRRYGRHDYHEAEMWKTCAVLREVGGCSCGFQAALDRALRCDLERVRAALDARPPQAPQEWHPIETAPKDGTMILLYPSRLWADDCDRGEAGYWDADEGGWGGAGSPADDYAGPTHWMPLPHPPAADARRPGQEKE